MNTKECKRILVALGGNAIKQSNEEGTTEQQFRNCATVCKVLAEIVRNAGKGDRLIITHGNGPQVGNLLVQQEKGKHAVPSQTMDIVVAMTQGEIGYIVQQELMNHLRDLGVDTPVCTMLSQVLVNRNDPEFFGEAASKPVGNFLTQEEAAEIKKEQPEYTFKKVKPTGKMTWRRCVASPDPIAIVKSDAIRRLVDAGFIVIASGGGGIPVRLDGKGHYKGVEAVIDKDLAGERLAEVVDANIFLIVTNVDKVKLNFSKHNEEDIDKLTLADARKYLKEGHFLTGSMKPKIKACIRFLEWGGEKAIITSLDKAVQALEGKAGTLIYAC
jgi:carbamate kinase